MYCCLQQRHIMRGKKTEKTCSVLPDHEIWRSTHIEPFSKGNQVLWAWSWISGVELDFLSVVQFQLLHNLQPSALCDFDYFVLIETSLSWTFDSKYKPCDRRHSKQHHSSTEQCVWVLSLNDGLQFLCIGLFMFWRKFMGYFQDLILPQCNWLAPSCPAWGFN